MQPGSQPIESCIDSADSIARGATPTPPRNERRSQARAHFQREVRVLWLDDRTRFASPTVLLTADISMGGVRLVGRGMLYPGARGALELARADGSTVVVAIEVVHTDYVGDMRYASGCRFIAMPEGFANIRFPPLGKPGRRAA